MSRVRAPSPAHHKKPHPAAGWGFSFLSKVTTLQRCALSCSVTGASCVILSVLAKDLHRASEARSFASTLRMASFLGSLHAIARSALTDDGEALLSHVDGE